MIGDIDVVLLDVAQRPSRDGTKVMFDVSMSDGQTYTSFDQELATKAWGLKGQQVTARVEAKPKPNGNGNYLNLRDVAPQGTLPAMAAQLASGATPMGAPFGSTPAQAPAFGAQPQAAAPPFGSTPQAASPIPQAQGGGGRFTEQDIARMNRSAAAATAATLMAGAYEGAGDKLPWGKLFSLAEAIVQYQYTGLNPLGAQPNPTNVAPTPEGVAAGVNGELAAAGLPVVQVGAGGSAEYPGVPSVAAAGDGIPF